MIATQVFEPRSDAELAQFMRGTESENLAIAPVGSGTTLGLGNPTEREGATLHTRQLRRVVEYNPEDQVVVVEAGITLGELQAQLAQHGQRLAIDPLGGSAMTIGGMIATNAYGPSALRYGTLKDLIVGIEVVRADGASARAGGKVVKNVAGFDVSKLMVGSLGTLAIVTKATFRLHPLPEASRTLAFSAQPGGIYAFVMAMREAQLEPAAIVVRVRGAEATVEVTFEGFGPGVDAQSERCTKIASEMGTCEVAPHVILSPSIPMSWAQASLGINGVEGRAATLKATFPPSEFTRVASQVENAFVFPSLGVAFFARPSTPGSLRSPYAQDDTLENHLIRLRSQFESLGGTLVIQDMPSEWAGKIDAWGTPPTSFRLMQALKGRFDPRRRLNPGRFVGGL